MHLYVSDKVKDPVIILEIESEDEAQVLNNFERTLGPLKAEILHPPGYGAPYLEIKQRK